MMDNDCDGTIDEGVAIAGFVDADMDGHGDPSMAARYCAGAAGFAAGFAVGAIKAIADPTVEGASAVIDDGLVAGVLIGAPLGALAAYLNSRARGVYEDIGFGNAYPVVMPTRTGGVGFGVSLPSR